MDPDHTLLLEEGEAFLALDQAFGASEVVAMRSPSYFKGDLRKLKLVNTITLLRRADSFQEPDEWPEVLRRTPQQRIDFFSNVKNTIILSVRGTRSEADRMSGGDYDGDMAWVCWNEDLVSNVQPSKAHDTSSYTIVEKEPAEQKVFWSTTTKERLDFFYNFRSHQNHLGDLSEKLDKCIDAFGFDHPFTEDLGRAAFLQVSQKTRCIKLNVNSSLLSPASCLFSGRRTLQKGSFTRGH
jgi:hypothetical protein